ncbi:MAG: pyruvate/2-oxoglutarate dehydrogenase complex dihydrolipoamide acyltransferase (E2) component [Bacteroidia bacterium]|jgi:pyruvate/2-oxoglutarate dehydrogenase complex dihydrolipoamide acyltransferase (E2) component
MSSNSSKHKLSLHQKMVGDAVRIGQTIPYIHTLVELNATKARGFLRAYRKKTGLKISFSTYLMLCCAKAVGQNTSIQQMKSWNNTAVTFDEVDFFFPIETESKTSELRSTLIRNVASKSLEQLQETVSQTSGDIKAKHRFFMGLPWIVRKMCYKFWFSFPKVRKQYFGTVYFSSIINFSGDRRAWGIPIPMHPFGIFIGTMCNRLIETSNGIKNQTMVQITLSVDHRVSNGGDMGRFVHRLKHILEFENLTENHL